MLLSVIIVNYKVKYFLEQCLCSVRKASMVNGEWSMVNSENPQPGLIEVLVVDNNSGDGSVEYIQQHFPFVRIIANTENTGFAKANNQALQQATGKYILFLNPDTILPENAFTTCLRFLEENSDAGALGVYMIDGGGQFLKESKRGFPTPWRSFCKMSGLIKLFPSSKSFAGYYAGHLPDNKTNEVDVLSGAYMLVKKEVLDKTGGFDERFFMYAEDIDLSYRIQQAEYKNYYLPECAIIHFKGESTVKDNRYTLLFYKAMIQFVQKHYRSSGAWLYTTLLKMAIWWKTGKTQNAERGTRNAADDIYYFTGDIQSVSEAKNILRNKTVVAESGKANTLVFCEGETFSYQKLIQLLNMMPKDKKAFIHGKGTNSVVSSHSKAQQGETAVLNY